MTTRERFHQLIEELPEEEAATFLEWIEKARQPGQNGTGSEEAVDESLITDIRKVSPEERARRVRAARGSFAHLPGSVDDFIRRKQEEIDHEEERDARRRGVE